MTPKLRLVNPVELQAIIEQEIRAHVQQNVSREHQAEIAWPKEKDVGRFGDMSPHEFIRVGLDSDNDVYVNVGDASASVSLEFCNPGGGGGRSPHTRLALINLMCAIEHDNAKTPHLDWWGRRISE